MEAKPIFYALALYVLISAYLEAKHVGQEPINQADREDQVIPIADVIGIVDRYLPHGPENPSEPAGGKRQLEASANSASLRSTSLDELDRLSPGVRIFSNL